MSRKSYRGVNEINEDIEIEGEEREKEKNNLLEQSSTSFLTTYPYNSSSSMTSNQSSPLTSTSLTSSSSFPHLLLPPPLSSHLPSHLPLSSEEVIIHFNQQIIQINLSNLTSFYEFDLWVRGRFGITNNDNQRIIYSNEKGQEIIPNFTTIISQQSLQVFISIETTQSSSSSSSSPPSNSLSLSSSSSSSSTSASTSPSSNSKNSRNKNTFEWIDCFSFSYLFPIFSLLYLLIFLSSYNPFPNPMRYFSIASPIMTFLGVEKEVQLSLYREMLCTFISWPVPYFFIRRSLNADFGFILSFTKFGSDAFWGAFAAAILVLLRHFVKANLSGIS